MTGAPMVLVGRYMSPYTRRVAVAMQLLGIPYERIVLSAITQQDKIRAYNPLGRVPVLILPDGEHLIESAAILDYLQEIAGPERRLLAEYGPDRRHALQLAAIMTNAIEKAIYALYETTRRPAELVYPPARETLLEQTRAGLRMIESKTGPDWLVGETCSLADITVAVGWRSICILAPSVADASLYPNLSAHSERCEQLPAFAACQPEPV